MEKTRSDAWNRDTDGCLDAAKSSHDAAERSHNDAKRSLGAAKSSCDAVKNSLNAAKALIPTGSQFPGFKGFHVCHLVLGGKPVKVLTSGSGIPRGEGVEFIKFRGKDIKF